MGNYNFAKYKEMLSASGNNNSEAVIVEEVQPSHNSTNNQNGSWGSSNVPNNQGSSWGSPSNTNNQNGSWGSSNVPNNPNDSWNSPSSTNNQGSSWGSSNVPNNQGSSWGSSNVPNNQGSSWGSSNVPNKSVSNPSRELVTQDESHYVKLEGMAEILNHFGIKADPNSACIYKPASTKAPVLPVPEIRDSNGRLAQKIKRLEQITHLSVIPFELSGLNSKVVEISGYTIYTLAGRRFISSRISPVYSEDELIEIAQNLIAKYCDAGGELKESLRTTVFLDRNTKTPTDPSNPNAVAVNTIAFNNYEIDFLTGALRELKASVICTGDDIFLVSGDLKGDM